ncbi:MAG: LacI family DNA-binding transcriptional regulator [Candidatus Limnocylindrales bacterium]
MVDIAAAVGVSQSTVSRVLSGAPPSVHVAPATRERIIAVAEQLGFRANPLARGLRGARTMLLGVVVGDITDPFFPLMIEAVTDAARARGYNVVLGHAHGRGSEAVALRAVLETRNCDALILLGDSTDRHQMLTELGEARVPTVSLARGSRHQGVAPSVEVDNRHGIRAAMGYLIGLGHPRTAYVGAGPYGNFPARRAAYLEFMHESGLRVRRGYDQHATNSAQGGADAFRALMALPEPPTAIVASTDFLAIGVLNAANRAGLRVPDDISVTGFDDLAISAFTIPPLTTVRMPAREMAAAAVSAAIGLADHLPAEGEVSNAIQFMPEFIIRDSCAPPLDRHARQARHQPTYRARRPTWASPSERRGRALDPTAADKRSL